MTRRFFKFQPMRTHYGPWQPCWISNQHQKHISGRGPSSEHFWQVWLISAKLGPYGNFTFSSFFLKPQNRFESNLPEMFIERSYPRFLFLALIVLVSEEKKFKHISHKFLCWNYVCWWWPSWMEVWVTGWSLGGQFSKLCPVNLTSIQDGHLQQTVLT
jgi:hypothetical protein